MIGGSRTEGPVLVLGAGGARGLAHIGVLKAMHRDGIRPAAVVGASMGAEVGAAYALGMYPDEIEAIALRTRRHHTLGMIASPRGLEGLFDALYGQKNLEDGLMPISVIATNLASGSPVILDRGRARDAVRASISIPGVFPVVPRGPDILVDGGISMPLPVSVARMAYPGHPVIAVSVCHTHLSDVSGSSGRLSAVKEWRGNSHPL